MTKRILSLFAFIAIFMFVSCDFLGIGGEPAIPGKIVFSAKDANNNSQIYTMNGDGSRVRQITRFEEDAASDPSWSPDGRRIVFSNYSGATTLGPYLYIMDADGGNMRPLKRMPTESPAALIGLSPAWSPDGTQIAYQVCTNCSLGGGNYEVVVVDVSGEQYDTSQMYPVTSHPASDTNPSWSPDGKRIVFASGRDYFDAETLRFRQDVYVANADGSNLERVTGTGYARSPLWHPNGTSITFRSTQFPSGLYQMDIQSGDIEEVKKDITSRTQFHAKRWPTDGEQLLILSRELDYPRENALFILDMNSNEMKKIYSRSSYENSNPVIQDADWFFPPEP